MTQPAPPPATEPAPAPPPHCALRHALLIGLLFAAIGVAQPFVPLFLKDAGLRPDTVALVLFAGAATRLLAGPLLGRLADQRGDPRWVLGVGAAAAAAVTLCWLAATAGPWLAVALLAGQLAWSLCMAPVLPLGEGLVLAAARRGWLDYGRVRAAGSVTFLLASVLAGWVAERAGFRAVPVLIAVALALGAACAAWLPAPDARHGAAAPRGASPLRLPEFRRALVLGALVNGSHATYYAFGGIHWTAAGHSAATVGLLWAEAVLVEVALFAFARRAGDRLGSRGLMLLACGAGLLRWTGTALSTDLWALVALQALHGLTFGAYHLATMRTIMAVVPAPRLASAQTLNASLGSGAGLALLMLLSGPLYAAAGGGAFLLMAVLCAAAVPVAIRMRP